MLIKQFLRAVYLFEDSIKITFDFSDSDTGLNYRLNQHPVVFVQHRFGTPLGARTLDTLIKSQVLYQLS